MHLRTVFASLALFLAGSVLVTTIGPVHAQTADDAYRFSAQGPAVGTRAMGMGGAGIAGWGDPSAVHTNPAGLGYYTESEISGGLNLLLSEGASTFQVLTNGPTFETTGATSSVQFGHLAGVYNVPTSQGSLVLAFGVNRTASFDRRLPYNGTNTSSSITDTFLPSPIEDEYEITDDRINISPIVPYVAFQAGAIEFFESLYQNGDYPFLQAVAPGRRIQQDGLVTRSGSMDEVNLSGAVEVAPDVMVGGSVDISSGTYEFEHELTETDLVGEDNYSVVAGNTLLEDFESVFFRTRFSSELSGFGLQGGISAEVIETLRLGFVLESPTWYSVEENFTNAFIRTNFSNGSLTYGDDDQEDEARGQFEYRLRTPARLGLGLSYHSTPLIVSTDIEFVDWSQARLGSDNGSTVLERANDQFRESFGYVFNGRAGVEYRFNAGLRLRIGGAYRPDPRTYSIRLADGSTTDRTRIYYSAGAGFELSDGLVMNIAWMQERMTDQFVPYPSVTPPTESQPIANPFIDEEIHRNRVQFGVVYSF